jgi:hypothetical protein
MGEGVRRSAPGRASTRRTRSDHTRGPVTAFRLRQRCPVRARRSESSAIRVWRCRKHTTAGKRDDSSAPRDQFAPTQRRRYSAKVSFSYAPRSPSPCPPRLPACSLPCSSYSPTPTPNSRRRRCQLEVSSSLGFAPQNSPANCTRAFFSPIISAAFPLANLLPHPRTAVCSCNLINCDYQFITH